MMNGPEKSDPAIGSWEPDEQSGVDPSGVGGAKGRDQGECGPIKHAPDFRAYNSAASWPLRSNLTPSSSDVDAVLAAIVALRFVEVLRVGFD